MSDTKPSAWIYPGYLEDLDRYRGDSFYCSVSSDESDHDAVPLYTLEAARLVIAEEIEACVAWLRKGGTGDE